MKKNNILLCGAHRTNNFGDTLLAFLFGKEVLTAGHQLCVPKANPELIKQLKTIGWQPRVSSERIDAVLFHGGGYFGEPSQELAPRWGKRMLAHHVIPHLRLLFSGRPFAILGVGVGPLSYAPARFAVKQLFNSATLVSVRDEESKANLKEYGVKRPIFVFPDAALTIGIKSLSKQIDFKSDNHRIKMGLHLSSVPQIDDSQTIFFDELLDVINTYDIDTVSFIDHEGRQTYQQVCNEIANHLSNVHCESRPLYNDMNDLLALIDTLDIVITDKLHVGICAVALGKVVISLPKHPKTERFYRQLGISDFQIDRKDLKSGDLFQILSKGVKEIGKVRPSVYKSIIDSSGHVDLLNEFLESI